MIRVGLFSDDQKLLPLLSSALGREFRIVLERDQEAMVKFISDGHCDVVVLDLDSNHESLPDRLASCRQLVSASCPSVVLADDALRANAGELVRLGAYGYCRKPPSVGDLETMLRRAYESISLKRQLKRTQGSEEAVHCDRMIGTSPQMRHVYDLVRRVADLNASVLVTGESGTGKELVARAIHNLGVRSSRPFVAVSCGAIPETLIEAELFGHEKGVHGNEWIPGRLSGAGRRRYALPRRDQRDQPGHTSQVAACSAAA